VAVEADGELYEKLYETFSKEIASGQLELVHGDIRSFDPSKLGTYKVVANIPYYLTGEIIRSFLETKNQPESMTLLVQKEVAERIARAKTESILSLSVKAFGTPKYEFTVSRGAFKPAPNVDSAVLTIKAISRKNFETRAHEKRFFEYVKAGFAHKRKFLRNNLTEAELNPRDLPLKVRAENISLNQWLDLSHLK
jgi:16S rRNA (adenine1518-N6/adenine1519-N6)-dimethyltransferase